MVGGTILRPSSAERWGPCAGSHSLEALYPAEDGPEAREGTAGHFWATEALQGRVWPVGTIAPNGVPITEEMMECGEVFLRAVADFVGPGVPIYVEHKLTMHNTVHPANEGTPDVWSIDWNAHRVTNVDYKYGHRYVEPFKNPQCVDYVAGVFEACGLTREQTKGWEVVIAIVQPRSFRAGGPVREWRALGWQIWEEIDRLREAAYRAKAPDAPTQTGPHCRDCSGRHACEALQRVGSYAIDLAGSSIPSELPDDALALQLRHIRDAAKRLDALKEGLEADALARMRQGRRLAGLQLEQGQGRETWSVPAAEVTALGDALGVQLRKDAVLTPNQARKAGLDPELVKAYAFTPSGELKVSEVSAAKIARAFK